MTELYPLRPPWSIALLFVLLTGGCNKTDAPKSPDENKAGLLTVSEAIDAADLTLLELEPREFKRLVKLCDGGNSEACAEALHEVGEQIKEPDGSWHMLLGLLCNKGCRLGNQQMCHSLMKFTDAIDDILGSYLTCVAPSPKGGEGTDYYTRFCIEERMDCVDIDRNSRECTTLTYVAKHIRRLDWEQITKLISESCLDGNLRACFGVGRFLGDEAKWSRILKSYRDAIEQDSLSETRRMGLESRLAILQAMDSHIIPSAKARAREVYGSAVDAVQVLRNAVIEYHADKCDLPPPPRIGVDSAAFRWTERRDQLAEKKTEYKVEMKKEGRDEKDRINQEQEDGCRPCDPSSVQRNQQAVEALGAVLPKTERTCLTYELHEDYDGVKRVTIRAVQDLDCDGFMAKYELYIKAENQNSPCLFQSRAAMYTLNEGN